jgi:PfaB family protein
MVEFTQSQASQIAIVGMDCLVGGCQGLDAFERSIFEGIQHFIPAPENRWQQREQTAPLGAYIPEAEINALRLSLPLDEADKFNHHQLLLLKVINHALKDAKLHPEMRIATVIVSESVENFVNSTFAFTSAQNSVGRAVNLAQQLLVNQQVDAVVISAVNLIAVDKQIPTINPGVNTLSFDQNADGTVGGEGAAAIVLQLHDTAQQQNQRIYAVINAVSLVESSPYQPQAVSQACQQAFSLANVQPADIAYLEVCGSGVSQADEAEIQGLIQAYRSQEPELSCAIGSIKANLGHTEEVSGILSLIKTALCLYYRYIPVVPQWTGPKIPQAWLGSPFYVASQSKPWFLELETTIRKAAINSLEKDGSYAHLILSEVLNHREYNYRYLAQIPYYLLPIAADDRASVLEQIHTLLQALANTPSLPALASSTFATFQTRPTATYALAILGHNHEELTRELQRAITGVNLAFDSGKDWQTPLGSYFTAKPQTQNGKVAFVYSGSFTSYIGIAQNLFRLFPQIYDDVLIKSVYERAADIGKIIYPRSLHKLSNRELEALEQEFIKNPISMLKSEVGFAGIMTTILKNYFQIQSPCAFGYSLGEISMMLAQGVWTDFKEPSDYLDSSPLFKTRLSGPKNAVREYWKMPPIHNSPSEDFWSNYVLMCPLSRVQEAVKHESRVYIPLINTPEEVVIAGESKACQRVIANLKCEALLTSINHVIHCEPMRSEYDEIVRINTIKIKNLPETVFYFAAEDGSITLDSHSIGRYIGTDLCQQLDFPRLINRVYNDGYRIFIEVGVGSNCSRWIDATLKHKEHLAISMNRRGVDAHTSIIKILAKLLSHRVSLDLSPLYSASINSQQKIKLDSKIFQPAIQEISKNTSVDQQSEPLISISNYPSNLNKQHYQKLIANNAQITKSHSIVLQLRQESLQKISILLQQQLTCYQGLVKQKDTLK